MMMVPDRVQLVNQGLDGVDETVCMFSSDSNGVESKECVDVQMTRAAQTVH